VATDVSSVAPFGGGLISLLSPWRHFDALTATSAVSLAFFGVLLALDPLVWITAQLKTTLEALAPRACRQTRMKGHCR
jgi:hypothetical protein